MEIERASTAPVASLCCRRNTAFALTGRPTMAVYDTKFWCGTTPSRAPDRSVRETTMAPHQLDRPGTLSRPKAANMAAFWPAYSVCIHQ